MKKYFFRDKQTIDDYVFIFLCGVHYKQSDKTDKRNVLERHLNNCNKMYRPIILEKYFMPKGNNNKNYLTYVEAGFSNLYQVEMLVNHLADCNIILLESISTGAEAGMFMGVPKSQKKTLILIPDSMAVEKDMLGAFLNLAFKRSEAKFSYFYPSIKRYSVSENVSEWRTSFFDNVIGDNLSQNICDFIEDRKLSKSFVFSFTTLKSELNAGKIYYKVKDKNASIEIVPRTLMICVGALLSCEYYADQIFASEGMTIIEIENKIVNWLKEVFINSLYENKMIEVDSCTLKIAVDIDRLSPNYAVGMIIYLYSAARFLEIIKEADYEDSQKVTIRKKFYSNEPDVYNNYFQDYADLIDEIIETQIN